VPAILVDAGPLTAMLNPKVIPVLMPET